MRSLITVVLVSALFLGEAGPASAASDAAAQFQQQCTACHTIGGGKRIGPDLKGVTEQRPTDWLLRWITHPDQVLAAKDPVAMQLLAESGQIPMPNLGVTEEQAHALIEYIRAQSTQGAQAAAPAAAPVVYAPPSLGPIQHTALWLFLGFAVVIAAVFIVVARSTQHPQTVDVHKAYGLRRVLFFVTSVGLLILLFATIGHTPYAAAVEGRPDHIIYVTARQFDFSFSNDPVTTAADLSTVATLNPVEVPAGSDVEFRVTALDVNHNFALYSPERRIVAQTQAMPGYVNRLRVRLAAPGRYEALCLEYCGAGHHVMQSVLTVK